MKETVKHEVEHLGEKLNKITENYDQQINEQKATFLELKKRKLEKQIELSKIRFY